MFKLRNDVPEETRRDVLLFQKKYFKQITLQQDFNLGYCFKLFLPKSSACALTNLLKQRINGKNLKKQKLFKIEKECSQLNFRIKLLERRKE
ncbi:unnamed protein product [Paramecium sonneborni]|uniref:Uncharacterized protein n=1 Tax=Paramecium sonneborni TaxID=65129 RepID=A0A8S1N1S4_9CILI|nr:unnamed protein product [Paramecium sonneborni]